MPLVALADQPQINLPQFLPLPPSLGRSIKIKESPFLLSFPHNLEGEGAPTWQTYNTHVYLHTSKEGSFGCQINMTIWICVGLP